MKILTALQTKKAEQIAFNMGINGARLMENAGSAAARVIKQNCNLEQKQVVVVVGQGNNGGDGYAGNSHVKDHNKKKIQYNVYGTADHQVI